METGILANNNKFDIQKGKPLAALILLVFMLTFTLSCGDTKSEVTEDTTVEDNVTTPIQDDTTTPVEDTTNPTVDITNPVSSTISGMKTITASASDDSGISSVAIYINNALVATDTTSPYEYAWNTTLETNGEFSIKAIAYDPSGNSGTDDDTSTTIENPVTKILFIGNSYTYVNDLPSIINNMASSVYLLIEYDQSTIGGAWFSTHVNSADTTSKIQSQDWDYVVLQNQSQVPGWKPNDVINSSLPNAQTLVNRITNNNASTKVIYFQTWGRENGDSQNCGYYSLVCTFDGHTQALKEGYEIYQSNTGGTIAPVGSVWQEVANDSDLPFNSSDLWSGDGSHPDILGSYLAALTIFSTIFNVSPEEITYDADLDEVNVSYLQDQVALFLGYK